jgi:PRC-barrel domain
MWHVDYGEGETEDHNSREEGRDRSRRGRTSRRAHRGRRGITTSPRRSSQPPDRGGRRERIAAGRRRGDALVRLAAVIDEPAAEPGEVPGACMVHTEREAQRRVAHRETRFERRGRRRAEPDTLQRQPVATRAPLQLDDLAGERARREHLRREPVAGHHHQDIGEWHGKELVDRNGERIGKLEDVYVDVETNEPMFGTVKEGLIGRHLTCVPLAGITIGPDNLQVTVAKEEVKTAPNIELRGDELSTADESTLFHHYQLNYSPPDTERGLRLARR